MSSKNRKLNTVKVIEHLNETVEIVDATGHITRHFPQFDLDQAKNLLEGINRLQTDQGIPLYSFWHYERYYIYPAWQEWLFWSICVPLVWHRDAWAALRNKKVLFENAAPNVPSRLRNLYLVLYKRRSFVHRLAFNLCLSVLRSSAHKSAEIMVYDDGAEGFRYKRLKSVLSSTRSFNRVERIFTLGQARKSFLDDSKYCIGTKAWTYPNPPEISYDAASFIQPYLSKGEFQYLIDAIHRHCCDTIAEVPIYMHQLDKHPPKVVLGYDQIEMINAYVIACKLHRVPVITYQHGLFTKFHAGWNAPGIPRTYCNVVPDKLIVWGDYWKQKLLQYSHKYDERNIVVGAHLRNTITHDHWNEPKAHSDKPLKVLLPFEFLTNNVAVSDYIRKFLALGWEVWVKLRPAQEQDTCPDSLAYDADVRDRIKYKTTLSPDALEEIDVIACTQSTFAFEMMPFQKPIWYLETDFQFIEIVKDGIAHSISHTDLENINHPGRLEELLTPRYTRDLYRSVFNDETLDTTLNTILRECGLQLEKASVE